MKSGYILFFLAWIGISFLSSCSNSLAKVLKSQDFAYKVKKANEFFDEKKYLKAQTVYEEIIPVLKGSSDYEDLYYRWAFCSYNQKDYLNAENIFKGFMDNFPNSKHFEEVEFLRAYSLYQLSPKPELDQTPTTKAITYLQTFINNHPQSSRNAEASELIDRLRKKLEKKDYQSAQLYYNLGFYRAAATAYNELMFNFPDSENAEAYKLAIINSWYRFANNSFSNKQLERFELVLNEASDFMDRFPDSKLQQDVQEIKKNTENKINQLKNEQTTQTNRN